MSPKAKPEDDFKDVLDEEFDDLEEWPLKDFIEVKDDQWQEF